VVTEFATVHGYRRAYVRMGHGPALLLVHGIGDSSATWRGLLPRLARNNTVIAPDLLGHGRSDKPRADYSVAGFACGMRDLLSVLDVDRVTVVGHSLGGGRGDAVRLSVP
jgi:pimeloyl-ACP methyl ester carboxylesterase